MRKSRADDEEEEFSHTAPLTTQSPSQVRPRAHVLLLLDVVVLWRGHRTGHCVFLPPLSLTFGRLEASVKPLLSHP